MDGVLYIVPTPIGNLKDITLRAIEVLRSADCIYCEDTRHSLSLLNAYDIKKPLFSLHKFNEKSRIEEIKKKLAEGRSIAYISDAGMPSISDPCELLVREVDTKIVALPGPTAFVPALVASGLDTSRFMFIGFLPSKSGDRRLVLEELVDEEATLIFYEAPHRAIEALGAMYEVFGNRRVAIAREISKLHEEIIRTDLKNASELEELRGELVITVEGGAKKTPDFKPVVRELLKRGLSAKSIIAELRADKNFKHVSRNEVYDFIVELEDE